MKSLLYKVYIAAILLLIVGGMAWGWMAMNGKNIVSKVFGSWAGIVYGLVGLSALFLLFMGRDAFLPFLGATVIPCSVLQDKVPEGADTTVSISVRPGAKVMYWASEPSTEGLKELQSWREAYGTLENAGIATANGDGVAILKFRKPQSYTVGFHGALQPHVHYRECRDNGWLEPVQTHFLTEGFQEETPEEMPLPTEEVLPVPLEEPAPIEPVLDTTTTDNTTTEGTTTDGTFSSELLKPTESTQPAQPMEQPQESNVEGFSEEPLLASVSDIGTTLASYQADPRLEQLKQRVQQTSNELIESNTMGFTEHVAFGGTELDEAFAAPEVQPIPPAV